MNRRKLLSMLGVAAGVGILSKHPEAGTTAPGRWASRNTPSCILTPQQMEGPYFVDEQLRRSNIRLDPSDGSISEGLPLALEICVSGVQKTGCHPVSGAHVDVWHCDASGRYSDVVDSSFNTIGKKFLRGYQVTDTNGMVRFVTIYPGWYPGRTVHIHFKIRGAGRLGGVEFTSQLYFDDSITDHVYTHAPYAGRPPRTTRNEEDQIFRKGGNQLLLSLARTGDGYAASFDAGIELPAGA